MAATSCGSGERSGSPTVRTCIRRVIRVRVCFGMFHIYQFDKPQSTKPVTRAR